MDGLSAVVVAAQEPAGENCPSGGVRIASGLDSDRNNELSAQEVTSVRYVCNGLQGAQGAKGEQGAQGVTGLPGANGTTTLLLANDGGVLTVDGGSITVWIEGTPGPQGPLGPQGPAGPRGLDGPSGAEGPAGPTGPQGPAGRVYGNVWKDADGGFVAFGDAVEPVLDANNTLSLAIRYTDASGAIWRVDRYGGGVSSWPLPKPYNDANSNGGRLGYQTFDCSGYPVLLTDGILHLLHPRFVYGVGSSYWSRGDTEQPVDVVVSSVYGSLGANGCVSPLVYGYRPNPWPGTMKAFLAGQPPPSPALAKPPDFVGPLHLEAIQ